MRLSAADFDLRYVLTALRRRLPLFLVCVLVIPAAAVAVSLIQRKQYTATAQLLFRDPQFDQKLFGATYLPSEIDPNRQAATNLDLVSLQRVAALTARHMRGMTEQQVSSAVSVSSSGEADIALIQATARTPQLAARLATRYANTYIAFRRDADRATIDSAAGPLRRQLASLPPGERLGALGQSIQQRLSQLRTLASLQTGGAELVQPAAVPTAPSSPKPVRNGAFGLFFGILLGLAAVVFAEARDRRVRDPAELEQLFERPLLVTLSESPALAGADPGLVSAPPVDREAFRMLWVSLRYFRLSRDIRSVLITSADRGDGKSTIAWGLAVTAASAGTRTLLIEADLRNPSLASRYGAPAHNGLTNVLAGDVDLRAAVVGLALAGVRDDATSPRALDVLFAGSRPPDPADLLQSQRMAHFMRDVEEQYELVVVDTPPAPIVSDATPLIAMVRGVIVVARLGNTLRDHARRLRQQFGNLDTPILGIVVNSVAREDRYGYAYGYGYDERAPGVPRSQNGKQLKQDGSRLGPPGSGVERSPHGDGRATSSSQSATAARLRQRS
jgi:capsular exopolysaccharide synthesis family protein